MFYIVMLIGLITLWFYKRRSKVVLTGTVVLVILICLFSIY